MAEQAAESEGLTERGRYWQSLLAEQAASGLRQMAFCRQRGIRPGTFSWWKNRLRHRRDSRQAGPSGPARAGANRPRPVFREMTAPVRLAGLTGLEVLLESGRMVRVPPGFDEADLRRLLGVLEAAC